MPAVDLSSDECSELKSCKRRIELYLRALWCRGFALQQADTHNGTVTSYVLDHRIYLPEHITLNQLPAQHYYRAAATHAALHAIYGEESFETASHNLMQRYMIGLVEDLRLELLAIKQFPGLRKLWLAFHPSQQPSADNAQNLMARLSRSVLDPSYEDNNLWVNKGKALILDKNNTLHDSNASLQTGLHLANDIGQMRLPLNSGRYEQLIIYRDDNRCLWQETKVVQQQAAVVVASEYSILQSNSLREMNSGMELKISDVNHGSGEGVKIRQQQQADFEYLQHPQEQVSSRYVYPEWDYRTHVLKKGWCTLTESHGKPGTVEQVNNILEANKNTLMRLRHIAKRLRTEKQQRIRKREEGDEIDIDPIINAMVAMRSRMVPDVRVYMQQENKQDKNMAIFILLDLSESTNELISDTNTRVSELMRDAVMLLGEALTIAGERFAISGFSSNGRHQVKLTNFKSFAQSFDDCQLSLANMISGYSTRLGAAIRHSEQYLARQEERKKLLLVITDGTPSDVDVYDKRYLEHDCWHAVHSLSKSGVRSFCLNLDGSAGPVIEHIFGRGRYETLDHIARLPEVLSRIYFKYARH